METARAWYRSAEYQSIVGANAMTVNPAVTKIFQNMSGLYLLLPVDDSAQRESRAGVIVRDPLFCPVSNSDLKRT